MAGLADERLIRKTCVPPKSPLQSLDFCATFYQEKVATPAAQRPLNRTPGLMSSRRFSSETSARGDCLCLLILATVGVEPRWFHPGYFMDKVENYIAQRYCIGTSRD